MDTQKNEDKKVSNLNKKNNVKKTKDDVKQVNKNNVDSSKKSDSKKSGSKKINSNKNVNSKNSSNKNSETKVEKISVNNNISDAKKINNNKKKTDNSTVKFFSDADNTIYFVVAAVIGFLIATLIFRLILWPDRIAELKDGTQPIATFDGGTITANDLYSNMKKKYSLNTFLNDLDRRILEKKYDNMDEIRKEAKENADGYYSYYSQAGYTKEQFLSENGFANEDEFLDILEMNILRNNYLDEYAKSLISDKEINKYYEKDVFGDVNTEHLLVTVSSDGTGLSDEDAKKLAKEIIAKLNGGAKWEDVVKEYKDKTTHEELGFRPFNASLESNYLSEMKNLGVGKYSTEPVKTSYGYHIVYKIEQKEKPSLDTVKDDIIDILATKEKDNDSNLIYKALDKLRKDNNLVFSDTVVEEEYNKYMEEHK